jgi:hypothetical protein
VGQGFADEPSYGIWGIVAVFVLLAGAGLALLLFGPASGGDSVQLDTAQTMPERDGRSGAPSSGAGGSDASGVTTSTAGATTSVTFPDGSPAPDGAAEVTVDGDTVSVRFRPPEGVDEASLALLTPVVPATMVRPVEGGRALSIEPSCSRSADEFLAGVSVTESAEVVSVAAVVLVPDGGRPCAGVDPAPVRVPLGSPLAGRNVVVLPAGTATPG